MNVTILGRLTRAEFRKLATTRALPVSAALSVALAVVSVVIIAMVAGKQGQPPLGTDASTNKMLKFGAVTCMVMLVVGIMASGGEFRHHTIVPSLLAAPRRSDVFVVKAAVIAVTGAVLGAVTFGIGLAAVIAELHAHGLSRLPAGAGTLYTGTVLASACFGMIGVALGALTRNTVGAIVAAVAWTLLVEQVILETIIPGIARWLPTGAAIALTNATGAVRVLSPAAAALVLGGYAVALLLVASRTSLVRDIG